ncbi:hypothetical protein GPJ56_004912 [Histomonas meleagridis]|uniref:uncharacterized protein n=1 Tax=Histomonas meleagridis TaxID=135588 RepID=UPI003559D320|nr:hypothetical protein GPJ56_004912 [Histomonas meleagridis]KAH0806300.1 hypothetical protein GO595_000988 [Histomonas meleagridis]
MLQNFHPEPLGCVPSVLSLISAAKMLEEDQPDLSGTFLCYAFSLCNDYFSQHPSSPEIDKVFLELKDLTALATISTEKELEQYGDSLYAAAEDSDYPPQMYSLAYLCYASVSIHGPLPERTFKKAKRVEAKVSSYIQPQPQPQQIQQNNYNNNTTDVPTVSYGQVPEVPEIVVNYPKVLDASLRQSMASANVTAAKQNPVAQRKKEESRAAELVHIARDAFKHGSNLIAYGALVAAIKDLENNQ